MLVTTLDFSKKTVRSKDPAADWLYHELIQYCSSSDFDPQQELPLDWFKARTPPELEANWLEGFGKIVAYEEAGPTTETAVNKGEDWEITSSMSG